MFLACNDYEISCLHLNMFWFKSLSFLCNTFILMLTICFSSLQALGLLFLLFSSWVAYVMFEDTQQGKTVFTSFGTTLYQMFVLFTTSNNPDVWIPAYKWASPWKVTNMFQFSSYSIFLFLNSDVTLHFFCG